MPVYEYVCRKCSKAFERFVHSPEAKVSCERCGSSRVRKEFSVFGVKVGGSSFSPSTSGCGRTCTKGDCSSCR